MTMVFASGAGAGPSATVVIGYIGETRPPVVPVSPIAQPERGDGLLGARLGISDDTGTGRFLGLAFTLAHRMLSERENPLQAARELAEAGAAFILLDLDAAQVTELMSGSAPRATYINIRAGDDGLRALCNASLLHTAPSRAMIADALAQYLVTMGWQRWFLVIGRHPDDADLASAFKRAAGKFGATIVAEKPWTFQPGNARADTGHFALETEIPVFTRVADHDVLVVADEADEFGEYLFGRTALPRPIAGTHGLVATGFDPVNEQWGASQLHSRFARLAGEPALRMGALDYAAWLAVRAVGEAAIRLQTGDPAQIAAYLRSPELTLGGYKGQPQSFREWDGQMRQPVLIVGPRLLVSVSPQAGFLHERSALDSLGMDRQEMGCAVSH